MKNRFTVLFFVLTIATFFNTEQLSAQIDSQASSEWIGVDSYAGKVTQSAFTYRINLRQPNINYKNWSMMVRANPYISNFWGRTIDPSRISIRLNRISGGPTIQDIGTNQTPIPLSYSNQYLFQNSNYPLKHGKNEYYSQYIFEFDIIVSGGAYLEELKSWLFQYYMNLTFTVVSAQGEKITDADSIIRMQIYPRDTPPSEPTYGIEINADAKNALLELKSVSDYVNGVEKIYENGLTITSKTPYQVQVRSLTSNFQAENNILPISTVSLEINDSQNGGVGGSVTLSENLQTVFNATNADKKPRKFNIRYFTKPNDERLIKAKSDSYTTTLMYTLTPQ